MSPSNFDATTVPPTDGTTPVTDTTTTVINPTPEPTQLDRIEAKEDAILAAEKGVASPGTTDATAPTPATPAVTAEVVDGPVTPLPAEDAAVVTEGE